MPKFTQEMVEVLVESGNRAFRSPLSRAVPLLTKYANDKYFAAIKDMSDLARESEFIYAYLAALLTSGHVVVAKRRAHPTEKKDLLTLMLQGKDPKTGQGLSDENIMYNVSTSLYASTLFSLAQNGLAIDFLDCRPRDDIGNVDVCNLLLAKISGNATQVA